MRRAIVLASAALAFAAWAGSLSAAETVAGKTAAAASQSARGGHAAPAQGTYTLRYRFQPGETLRWKVIQRVEMTTTVSGTTQTVSTVAQSVKAWRIQNVGEDGTVTFQNSVESVDLRHKFSGVQEVHYNSQTDKKPPHGFEDAARRVGVPLAQVTMDSRGQIQSRLRNPKVKAAAEENEGPMTVPLPAEAVAVGQTWSLPSELALPLAGGTVKKIKTMQKFKLAGVERGVATIELSTLILTPIHDPSIEVQLIQRDSSSTIRFDIEAGRLVGQQVDIDKRVVGFRGEASSLHYLGRVNEEALSESSQPATRTASTAAAGADAATQK
jgi:hypothetical protein